MIAIKLLIHVILNYRLEYYKYLLFIYLTLYYINFNDKLLSTFQIYIIVMKHYIRRY